MAGLLDTKNYLLALLSQGSETVKGGLLDAYQTATQPNQMDNALAMLLKNTPQRLSDNINTHFPDPRLLNPYNKTPEANTARENVANALMGFGGMMVGPKAKVWNAIDHAKALEMESAGLDPRKIWADTGNWKGPEGKWRQEVSDDRSKFRENFDSFLPNKGNNYSPVEAPIGGLFNHGDLLSQNGGAYPELMAKTRMNIAKSPDWMPESSNGGSLEEQANNFKLFVRNKTEGGAHKTTLHELQHAIQEKEGFAKGGTPNNFTDNEYQKALSQMLDNGIPLTQAQKELEYLTPYGMYRRLAGEAEARATEKRMLLDAIGRRQTFPADSYDVPLNELIIRR